MKLIGDRLAVKMEKAEETVVGGGIVVPVSDNGIRTGTVTNVGTGRYEGEQLVPVEVSVGDKILFTVYQPTEIVIGGEKLVLVHANDIMAILEDGDE